MNEFEKNRLLSLLDGTGSDEEKNAGKLLLNVGPEIVADLTERYRKEPSGKARASCVYHAIYFVYDSPSVLSLGIEALNDSSKAVRYRACMLLAKALDRGALEHLKHRKNLAANEIERENFIAAIDAIENQNSNYFIDREHSGKIKWNIGF